jgi:uncharacterized membrane protein YjjP (DUF1212 family)
MEFENKGKELYKESFADYLLCLALDVGEGMLRCGGEVSRVEDTIERLCRAYGAAHVEVFSIISVIHAAVRMPDGSYSSQMRRIKSTGTNLGLLEKYNALSRKICAETPTLSEFDGEIAKTKRSADAKKPLLYLASSFAAGVFALFFGGSAKDALVAFFIGALIELIDLSMPPRMNAMAKTVVSSFVTTAAAVLCATLGIADGADFVIMGSIMLLVPGVAFGTAMRDLLYGDLLSGTLKTLQAVLSALMIAFGYMISVELLGLFGVALPAAASLPFDGEVFFKPIFFIAAAAAFISSVAFALLFKVAPRHLLYGGLCGLGTYVVYYIVEFYTGGMPFPAAFVSTVFCALFAEVASRVRKAPTIIFLIPGVIPTVPGGALYRSMRAMLLRDWHGSVVNLLTTVQIGLGIAGGILAVSIVFGTVMDKIKKSKKGKITANDKRSNSL